MGRRRSAAAVVPGGGLGGGSWYWVWWANDRSCLVLWSASILGWFSPREGCGCVRALRSEVGSGAVELIDDIVAVVVSCDILEEREMQSNGNECQTVVLASAPDETLFRKP